MDQRYYGGCTTAPTPGEGEESVLMALGQAVELRDSTTAGHCERLALHSLALGVTMGLTRDELFALHRGGFLHDIGKVGLPDAILFKAAPLSDEEWTSMRRHPVVGEQICRRLRTLEPVLPIVRSHHEKWDGSGYPDGLRGSGIPLLARVLQFADIYDALTTERPYKPAYTPAEALETMQRETACGWRDPELMELFLRMHRRIIAAVEEFEAIDEDRASMELSLRQLARHLASDAAATRKPAPARTA